MTVRDPGFWSVHFWRCVDVHVKAVTVLVDLFPRVRPTNTDGINPDSSRNVPRGAAAQWG